MAVQMVRQSHEEKGSAVARSSINLLTDANPGWSSLACLNQGKVLGLAFGECWGRFDA